MIASNPSSPFRVPSNGPVVRFSNDSGKVIGVVADGTLQPVALQEKAFPITDYGASPTATAAVNSAAVATAISAWSAWSLNGESGYVYFPGGTFSFVAGIALPANVQLVFSSDCVVVCTNTSTPLFDAYSQGNLIGTIATTTDAYADVVQLTVAPAVGDVIAFEPNVMTDPSDLRQNMIFVVTKVTGAASPYSVTLDRAANIRFGADTPVRKITNFVQNVSVSCNDALFKTYFTAFRFYETQNTRLTNLRADTSLSPLAINAAVVWGFGVRDFFVDGYYQEKSSTCLGGVHVWSAINGEISNVIGVGLGGGLAASPLVDVDDALGFEVHRFVANGFGTGVLVSCNSGPAVNPLHTGSTSCYVHDCIGVDCGVVVDISEAARAIEVERIFSSLSSITVRTGSGSPTSGTDPTVVGSDDVTYRDIYCENVLAGGKGIKVEKYATKTKLYNLQIASGSGYLPADLDAPTLVDGCTWAQGGGTIQVGNNGPVGSWSLANIHPPSAGTAAAGTIGIYAPDGSDVLIERSTLRAFAVYALSATNAVNIDVNNVTFSGAGGTIGYKLDSANARIRMGTGVAFSVPTLSSDADALKSTWDETGGTIAKSVTVANVVLTPSEAQANRIQLSGVLTGNRTVSLQPIPGKRWEIENACTGGYNLTINSGKAGDPGFWLPRASGGYNPTVIVQVDSTGALKNVNENMLRRVGYGVFKANEATPVVINNFQIGDQPTIVITQKTGAVAYAYNVSFVANTSFTFVSVAGNANDYTYSILA